MAYLDSRYISHSTSHQHDHHAIASLALDSSCQSSSAFNGFPAPLLNSSTGYHPDVSTFYTPNTHIYSNLEPRSRYSGSDSASSTGMSHVQRSAALPNPSYSTRDLYSRAIPSYPGRLDHAARSATTAAPLRRHPLSPTPSPSVSFTSPSSRMDTAQFSSGQQPNVPPLLPLTMHGRLCHSDPNSSPVSLDIQGTIDKGFFYSEGDWTCYRRNYFSCMCSYNYTPMLPSTSIQFTPDNSSHTYTVFGFAMSISAVVAESDSTQIDLVQHTPKRDKGPVSKPEKVRLEPRPPQQMGIYGTDHARMFEGGYMVNARGSYPTEHTFERIQFKQATANNGKRRAAQQYYHLVIELYADIGNQSPDQTGYIKIAQRKSAKMIVRGRSPGHYQQDRRGSTGSGGGNSNGMGGYGSHPVLGSDYGTAPSSLLPSTYGNSGYDGRHTGHYSTNRHVDVCRDTTMAEDPKLLAETKDYQYFPGTIYEGTTDANPHRVEMFTHRNDHNEHLDTSRPAAVSDGSRVKPEYDGHASTLYNPGAAYYPGNCQRFEGRPTSSGYYPTIPTNTN